jgi:hypothetical protein
VQDEDTSVGVSGTRETSGGVLSVTVTCAPPLDVLQDAHQQLAARVRNDSRRYWALTGEVSPEFAPVSVSDSRTTMSNLSPRLDGSLPADTQPPAAPGAPTAGSTLRTRLVPRYVPQPRTVPVGRDVGTSNLDAWYMRIDGQGPGSINPAGENAFTALCGSLPTAILYQGFHGTYSPVVISQTLNLKVWSENLGIHIHGDWDRIFTHFSNAAHVGNWWWDADIKQEFNNLRISGGITVTIEIDGTTPDADKMKSEVDKRVDLIVQKFTDEAKGRIFDPAPPTVTPATAAGTKAGGIFGLGGGYALNYRRDETKLSLSYDETRQERYNLATTISSSLEGFYTEIKADPDAERKYFPVLYLDDWDRKITHNFKPVVRWPDPARDWVGDPVAWLGVQMAYPDARGALQWQGHLFQSSDSPAAVWSPAVTRKPAADVADPPPGWTPDVSYIKRTIQFTEPPSETDNPYVHCFVEKNSVDIDPEPNGTATNDLNIEVRADSVGKLDVGPITLNVALETPAQVVEVEFRCDGKTADGQDRQVTRFTWNFADQDRDRFWTIFTGQPDLVPSFQYRCHVIVKGSLLTKGMEWYGPWQHGEGNGPLMVTVPTADSPGVQPRSLIPGGRPAIGANGSASPAGTPGTSAPVGAPPSSGVPIGAPPTRAVTSGSTGNGGTRGRTVAGFSTAAPADNGDGDGLVLAEGWTAVPPRSLDN